MFWAILGTLSMMGVVAIIYALSVNEKEIQEESKPPSYVFDDFGESEGLGAPLFVSMQGRKPLVRHLTPQSKVFALTPVGPLEMRVKYAADGKGQIENDEYLVDVVFDTRYFSDTVADKLNHHCGAWRVSNIFKKTDHTGKIAYTNKSRWSNRYWLEEESSFEIDDLFDILLFYELMFDNFTEPYDYYGELEPSWDIPTDNVIEDDFSKPVSEPSEVHEPLVEEEVIEEPVLEEIVEESVSSESAIDEDFEEEVRRDPVDVGWGSDDSGYSTSDDDSWSSGGDDFGGSDDW
jgi:hypothetical protein